MLLSTGDKVRVRDITHNHVAHVLDGFIALPLFDGLGVLRPLLIQRFLALRHLLTRHYHLLVLLVHVERVEHGLTLQRLLLEQMLLHRVGERSSGALVRHVNSRSSWRTRRQ